MPLSGEEGRSTSLRRLLSRAALSASANGSRWRADPQKRSLSTDRMCAAGPWSSSFYTGGRWRCDGGAGHWCSTSLLVQYGTWMESSGGPGPSQACFGPRDLQAWAPELFVQNLEHGDGRWVPFPGVTCLLTTPIPPVPDLWVFPPFALVSPGDDRRRERCTPATTAGPIWTRRYGHCWASPACSSACGSSAS